MAKVNYSEKLSETLTISECSDGFWLYDDTRGMNLAMRAESREIALLEALEYYQRRLQTVESDHRDLSAKVDNFVNQFINDDENDY